MTIYELLIAVGPLLPMVGFFWANCPCCGPSCGNCPDATASLSITVDGVAQAGTICSACTNYNGTYIVPYWAESVSNTSQTCDWKYDLNDLGSCENISAVTMPQYLMARLQNHATLPLIHVAIGYRTPPFQPTHALALDGAFGWSEDQSDGLTSTALCDTYTTGYDFTTAATSGVCDPSAATCHVEGA